MHDSIGMGDLSGIKMNVLITDNVNDRVIKSLKGYGFEVEYKPGIGRDELLSIIGEYDILIVRSRTKVVADVIDAGKKLKIIARAGVGLDNIDVNYAVNRGIAIVNSPRSATYSAAELAIGLMIGVARRINLYNLDIKNGKWSKGAYEGMELRGKTMGIVGFGRIGKAVAEVGKAMGMKINVTDVVDVGEEAKAMGAHFMDLRDLLTNSDVITIHVSLTKDTYHMINGNTLKLIKDNSIIINTSRGEVIDSKALLDHLDRLWGVGLDVLEHEPPHDEWELKITAHPKVLMTPHIGAETKEAQDRIVDELLGNLLETVKRVVAK